MTLSNLPSARGVRAKFFVFEMERSSEDCVESERGDGALAGMSEALHQIDIRSGKQYLNYIGPHSLVFHKATKC
jgi:hypothetical protein